MFFNVEELPLEVRKLPLTIIQEATYGYVNSTEMKAVFEENVAKAIAEKENSNSSSILAWKSSGNSVCFKENATRWAAFNFNTDLL